MQTLTNSQIRSISPSLQTMSRALAACLLPYLIGRLVQYVRILLLWIMLILSIIMKSVTDVVTRYLTTLSRSVNIALGIVLILVLLCLIMEEVNVSLDSSLRG